MARHDSLSRRRFATAALGAAVFGEPAQESEEKLAAFSSTTNLVLLDVSVVDRRGTPVTGLQKENFQVRDSGRARRLTHFSTGAEPVCAGLVVDFSRSMRPNQEIVASAAAQFTKMLEPPDELFLVLFNEAILFENKPTRLRDIGHESISQMVRAARPDGQTALYDAALQAARISASAGHPRRVLVIVSDGKDTASRSPFGDALETIESANLLIYTVGILDPVGEHRGNPAVLRRLAEATGGLAILDPDTSGLAGFFSRIIADLRARYVLGFLAESPISGRAETRKLKVEVIDAAHRNVMVRARKQYRIKAGCC